VILVIRFIGHPERRNLAGCGCFLHVLRRACFFFSGDIKNSGFTRLAGAMAQLVIARLFSTPTYLRGVALGLSLRGMGLPWPATFIASRSGWLLGCFWSGWLALLAAPR